MMGLSAWLSRMALAACGLQLTVCVLVGSPQQMLGKILDHWLMAWPQGAQEVDGVALTGALHYIDLSGDATGDGRIDLADFCCISQNWRAEDGF